MQQIICSPTDIKMSFVLDPCLVPAVLALCAAHGMEVVTHVYYLARTFAYYMHRGKLISLGRWPGDHGNNFKPKLSNSKNNLIDKCSLSGRTSAPPAVTPSTTTAISLTNLFVTSHVPSAQHHDEHTIVSDTLTQQADYILAPGQHMHVETATSAQDGWQAQHVPRKDVECDPSVSQGGGAVSGVVTGCGVDVTGAWVRTLCTPPASQPWRGGTGKVQ